MPPDNEALEQAIFREVIFLRPARLTVDELTLRMSATAQSPRAIATGDSIQNLKRDGVLRQVDSVLEPTYPSLRTAMLLTTG